jgi:hypothetical protein
MEKVNYLKLAEQYSSFLVAVGSVSITALVLVLSLDWKSKDETRSAERVSPAFLVATLVVATVCCFIGAHMMAETAAFLEYVKGANPPLSGERPFLLASTNIFIATALVLFALMLLPRASKEEEADNITPISKSVFGFILVGAVYWMFRAALYRMPPPSGWRAIALAVLISMLWGGILYFLLISEKYWGCVVFKHIVRKLDLEKEKVRNTYLLKATFIPIIIFTVTSLVYFASIFGNGDKVHDKDIFFFTLAVTFSYASLIIASLRTMRRNKAK